MIEIMCPECRKPLSRSEFNGHYVWMCNNWQCPLWHKHQIIEAGNTSRNTTRRWSQSPNYPKWLERRKIKRKERYKEIRKFCKDPIQALRLRDMTSMSIDDIRELVKQ